MKVRASREMQGPRGQGANGARCAGTHTASECEVVRPAGREGRETDRKGRAPGRGLWCGEFDAVGGVGYGNPYGGIRMAPSREGGQDHVRLQYRPRSQHAVDSEQLAARTDDDGMQAQGYHRHRDGVPGWVCLRPKSTVSVVCWRARPP